MNKFDNFEWYKYIGQYPTAWQGHLIWAYAELPKLNPKVVVELGVHWGHSFFTMAESCMDHGMNTTLYGIDHWKGDIHAGKLSEDVYETVQQCAKEYDNIKLVKKTFDDANLNWYEDIDLLHIDGRHLYEDIKEDFENWEPLVKEGGTIWLHDTQVEKDDFGVGKYFKELRQTHPEWIFDERLVSNGLGIIRK